MTTSRLNDFEIKSVNPVSGRVRIQELAGKHTPITQTETTVTQLATELGVTAAEVSRLTGRIVRYTETTEVGGSFTRNARLIRSNMMRRITGAF